MSDSDPQRRARPQYGEYATPEEQRAAIKQPAEWQLEDRQADAPPAPPAPEQPVPGSYRPGGPQHGQGSVPPSAYHWPPDESRPPQQRSSGIGTGPRTGAGIGDRLTAFVLLGFGLSNVLSTVSDAFNDGRMMRESMAVMGASYAQIANALPGWLWQAQAVIYAAVWLVTAVVTISSMRAGRRVWWIPLLGAVVAFILFGAIFVITLGEHPELLNLVPTPTPGVSGSGT